MKLLTSVTMLASVALAVPRSLSTRQTNDSPLDVRIEMDGNSRVKAVLTNNGNKELRLLKTGTFLDQAPVEKAKVYTSPIYSESAVDFSGIRLRVAPSKLTAASFQTLGAGQSVTTDFDLAHVHDLSSGGTYHVELSGALSTASGSSSSSSLAGSVPYRSNRLSITVDGPAASAAASAFHLQRRAKIQDCNGTQLSVTRAALSSCAKLASAAAASAAASNSSDDKMTEYFKAADNSTRGVVSGVFRRVAAECGSTTAGVADYYCSDPYDACSDGVLAYTVPTQSYMAYCPLYFTELPPRTERCHAQDQATTNLHEVTHLRQVKGTEDYGGYGYDFVQSLTKEQNLNHADTYALFANAINLRC
ncbi:hypothetical protein LMH87_006687 [Akanthomyces muscarius]|uniref:Neutral protease 2 n=1 Tax=Akanthomyces muscarius TaxID=2231603 RepID=A0A9W8UT24_AKAMU|nr:hypothetical protein LMH87_006687 [Akanthomyces muscarius]KAJ4165040.1 hypothetical protein LMH87_006687 [Akanthomyces muscarius]